MSHVSISVVLSASTSECGNFRRMRLRPHSDYPGGLNGSLQHLLKVFL
jgi:hypothetical protein